MAAEQIEYHFILRNSPYYQPAVTLRHNVFSHPSSVHMDQLVDNKEGRSTHLVAIFKEEVVGYIRITLDGKTAQLSQFVVAPQMQGKAGIAKNLYAKAISKAKEMGARKISGEIRLPMAGIASRLGYSVSQPIPASDYGATKHRAEKEL
jgi:predicted GNAT family acetyltransferase